MDEKELRLLLLLATSCCQLLLLEEISKKRKRRKIWANESLRKRNTLGAYTTIISEFQLQDRYSYRKYLRIFFSSMSFLLFKFFYLLNFFSFSNPKNKLNRSVCVMNSQISCVFFVTKQNWFDLIWIHFFWIVATIFTAASSVF